MEVYEIQRMFRVLERCYEQLPDKSGINSHWLKYEGFDANDPYEFRLLQYADHRNSHWPMLATYRRMLSKWQSSRDRENLTKEDILRIIDPNTV